MNWKPIETAPKDGSEILGWREDCGILLIMWTAPTDFLSDEELERIGESSEIYDWFYADFVGGGRLDGDLVPTYWMPLPEPPKQENKEQT